MGQGELARTGLPCLAYCIYCGVGISGGNRVHVPVEQICITLAGARATHVLSKPAGHINVMLEWYTG